MTTRTINIRELRNIRFDVIRDEAKEAHDRANVYWKRLESGVCITMRNEHIRFKSSKSVNEEIILEIE